LVLFDHRRVVSEVPGACQFAVLLPIFSRVRTWRSPSLNVPFQPPVLFAVWWSIVRDELGFFSFDPSFQTGFPCQLWRCLFAALVAEAVAAESLLTSACPSHEVSPVPALESFHGLCSLLLSGPFYFFDIFSLLSFLSNLFCLLFGCLSLLVPKVFSPLLRPLDSARVVLVVVFFFRRVLNKTHPSLPNLLDGFFLSPFYP